MYSAVSWGPANVIMIEGDEGLSLVDTGREKESSTQIRMEFEKITAKPIKAIIYTHFHPNLYPLRGGPFRDPRQWMKSLDVMRNFTEQLPRQQAKSTTGI